MIRLSGSSATRLTVGAGCVALGLLLALDGLGVAHLSWGAAFRQYWPSLLVLWGLIDTALSAAEAKRLARVRGWPLMVAALGAFLLAEHVHLIAATAGLVWTLAWAALAVFIGLEILFGGHGRFAIGATRYSARGRGRETKRVHGPAADLSIGTKRIG